MAYVLGFFAADGYITVGKRGGYYWSIDIRDRLLLVKIRNAVGSGHTISQRKRKCQAGSCYTYRLQIGSKEMCADLQALGFWYNKTNSMTVPFVPDELFRDFVRGYFDGDGHVWMGMNRKGGIRRFLTIQTAFTSCSLIFLEQLGLRLETHGVGQGRISRGKGSYYRLRYSVRGSLKMHNFMYNGLTSPLFLQRKRAVFEKFKENAAVAQR